MAIGDVAVDRVEEKDEIKEEAETKGEEKEVKIGAPKDIGRKELGVGNAIDKQSAQPAYEESK